MTISRTCTPSPSCRWPRASGRSPRSARRGCGRCRARSPPRPRRGGRDAARGTPDGPPLTRSPSHTPSPSTKPASNTDTTACVARHELAVDVDQDLRVARIVVVVVRAVRGRLSRPNSSSSSAERDDEHLPPAQHHVALLVERVELAQVAVEPLDADQRVEQVRDPRRAARRRSPNWRGPRTARGTARTRATPARRHARPPRQRSRRPVARRHRSARRLERTGRSSDRSFEPAQR